MKAKIICYTLGKIKQTKRTAFKRELNGYIDISNNSKYKYKRPGILQKIPHHTPIRSAIIVKKQDKNKIIQHLKKYQAKYSIFDIEINPEILKN